jgi:hypothetical protein
MPYLPCHYLYISFISCTCWVPIISVLNLTIFPYYSKLLLRRRGWTGILRRGVLGYVLPRLSFLWCYRVFHCSVPLRVIIVFRDTIYVIIIILYSWHLIICEHFCPYVWNNWSWVMHAMSTWFWHKNWVWQWSGPIRGSSVGCVWRVGQVFPCRVYIDSNRRDSRIWVPLVCGSHHLDNVTNSMSLLVIDIVLLNTLNCLQLLYD